MPQLACTRLSPCFHVYFSWALTLAPCASATRSRTSGLPCVLALKPVLQQYSTLPSRPGVFAWQLIAGLGLETPAVARVLSGVRACTDCALG